MLIKGIKNSALIIGIVINAVLLFTFIYMFFYSVPKKGDLAQTAIVQVPNIEDNALKEKISSLNKIRELPLNVDPSEIGKQNPYNY